jgi:hypothetical protein
VDLAFRGAGPMKERRSFGGLPPSTPGIDVEPMSYAALTPLRKPSTSRLSADELLASSPAAANTWEAAEPAWVAAP